ncbi:MAG: hypothetical protein LBJ37_24940 [Paucimonas sp.]|jgi:hypothetical protein|nr:hypothetical protein [Paucimonas sp.]
MEEFHYVVHAEDGSHEDTKTSVVAANDKEAQKLARARFDYPVRLKPCTPGDPITIIKNEGEDGKFTFPNSACAVSTKSE